MNLNEEQIADSLLNENSDSETEDHLEVDPYDSDDSAADPSFMPFQLEEDLQNIVVDESEPPNISEPHQATSNASESPVPETASQEEQTVENLKPSASAVRGKNNYIWSRETSDRSRSMKTAARNVVNIFPGPKQDGRDVIRPLDCFEKFFSSDMIDEVLLRTNEDISVKATKYKQQSSTISLTRKEELHALLGLIIFSGAMGNNDLPTKELFDPILCGSPLLNSYILHVSNSRTCETKPKNKREYMKELSTELCRPWCELRGEERPKMRKRVRDTIQEVLAPENLPTVTEPGIRKGKRSMCSYCPANKRRMTVYYCAKCKKNYCLEHRSPNCSSCDKK